MPAYIVCPHCHHPTVLSTAEPGRRYCCRQCNGYYVLRAEPRTEPSESSGAHAVGNAAPKH